MLGFPHRDQIQGLHDSGLLRAFLLQAFLLQVTGSGTEAECKPSDMAQLECQRVEWTSVHAPGLRRAHLCACALQLRRGRADAAVVQRAERCVQRGNRLNAQQVPCTLYALSHRARSLTLSP